MRECHLSMHMIHHSNVKSFVCDQCDQSFKTKQHLKRHVLCIHDFPHPYICSYCGMKFKKRQLLKVHETSHTGLSPHPCTYLNCSAQFSFQSRLLRHMSRYHKVERQEVSPYHFQCMLNDCQATFPTLEELQTHRETLPHQDVKIFQCETCHKQFTKAFGLSQHMKSHTLEAMSTEYPCPEEGCFKSFSKKWGLRQHIAIVHCNERFICNEVADGKPCAASFRYKKSLDAHIGRCHQGREIKKPEEISYSELITGYFGSGTHLP
eukprot:Sdes_comp20690_c0_seq2m16233